MLKKSLVLIAISSIVLVSGCSGPKHDLGGFLGELSCLTAEADGQTSTEDIAQVAQNHGFETESSVQDLIDTLDDKQKQKELEQAVNYVASNCQDKFNEVGIDAAEFLAEVLADY